MGKRQKRPEAAVAAVSPAPEKKYRISGHESFPCRYAWLPKVVRGIKKEPHLFSNEEDAMVELGLGKNMVRSARFWAHAAGISVLASAGYETTDFGEKVLAEAGFDPYLEDIRTLWLIHWNLATNTQSPLLAWDYLINHWQEPELVPSACLRALHREALKQDDGLSSVTIEQHLNTFFHTYVPTRGRKGKVQEENLDCPLVELEFISKVGERELDRVAGDREPIYAFRREEKPEISAELFTYCLIDFWEKHHAQESTLSFRDVAYGHGSPGQIFKLPEEDIRARLDLLKTETQGAFAYIEGVQSQKVNKNREQDKMELLKAVYCHE